MRADFLRQCARYWPYGAEPLGLLPMPALDLAETEPLPPACRLVALPEWAADTGVDGALLAPEHCADAPAWNRVDWPLAGAWFLHSLAERAHEKLHGPIHSYAFRLRGWRKSMWERAWANRIALFLRRWTARESGRSEESLFGPLPQAEIIMTFDVDAIGLTPQIRLKQGVFNLLNAIRAAAGCRFGTGMRLAGKAFRFFLGPGEVWPLSAAARMCAQKGLRAVFTIPGLPGGSFRENPKRWLFDPAYDPDEIRAAIRSLADAGHTIGLHPSFMLWRSGAMLAESRRRLHTIAGRPVAWCRQHWLRFSFAETWRAQQDAGLSRDCTLGFNDLAGFRNGAAFAFSPWDAREGRPMDGLTAVPLVFMDSQAYDYAGGPERGDFTAMRAVLDEVRAVRGTATVLWHPHTLYPAYGWEEGLQRLAEYVSDTAEE